MQELDAGDKIGDLETALENLKAWDINFRGRLQPSIYAGSFAQESDAGKPVYRREMPVRIFDNSGGPADIAIGADTQSNGTAGLLVYNRKLLFNGVSWDRERSNTEEEVLASAVRTATTTTDDQTNFNHRGLILTLSITAVPTTETLTLNLQHKLGDGTYVSVVATAADADAGQHIIVSYPSASADTYASTFQQEVHVDNPLPRTWRAVITHSASGNWTYSLEALYLL